MPNFFHDPDVPDTTAVQYFLDFVQNDFLGQIVETGKDPTGHRLIPEERLPAFQAAWAELAPTFQLTRDAVLATSTDLSKVALVGENMKLKRSVIGGVWDRFRDFGGNRLFQRLIRAVDSALQSVFAALGVGEGIAEFKDMLGIAAEEQHD